MLEDRLVRLFHYYGGTRPDVQYEHALVSGQRPSELLEQLDYALVFMARYARFDPEYTDALEVPQLERYVDITTKLIKAENGKREEDPLADPGDDFG